MSILLTRGEEVNERSHFEYLAPSQTENVHLGASYLSKTLKNCFATKVLMFMKILLRLPDLCCVTSFINIR